MSQEQPGGTTSVNPQSTRRDVEGNALPATTTRRNADGSFAKGNKMGGRTRMDPDVKAMLVDATPDRIRRLEKLSRDAESAGDLKTAAHIEISLLKKTVPDTTELLVGGVDGSPLRVGIDIAKLTTEQLDQLAAIRRALTGG